MIRSPRLAAILAGLALGTALASAHAAGPAAPAAPVAGPAAAAAPAGADAVRQAVESWFRSRGIGAKVDGVRATPVTGLLEVQVGNDLFYADVAGRHALIDGQLVDLRSGRNLTQERVDDISRIDFRALPFDLALKQVIGDGRRQLAVFEDPNCPYCRNLRRDLLKLDNVTIWTFTLPILSADSEAKVKATWCAPDRMKAWNDMVMSGRMPEAPGAGSPKANCDAPVAKLRDLGRRLGVTGTPTVFFANGKRVPGVVPPERLRSMLDEASKG